MVFELVFENVPASALGQFMHDLAGKETNSDSLTVALEDGARVILPSAEEVNALLDGSCHALFGSIPRLRLENAVFQDLSLRTITYNGKVDVEISFDSKDQRIDDGGSALRSLQAWSMALSNKHRVEQYFFGFEPASDIETRLFTGQDLGPLSEALLQE